MLEDESDASTAVYMRLGKHAGHPDLLAEQLRVDSVVLSTGPGIRLASEATLELALVGIDEDDDNDIKLCDVEGWTPSGHLLTGVSDCVVARVDLDGE